MLYSVEWGRIYFQEYRVKKKILVIDDESILLNLMRDILNFPQLEVILCSTAFDGLKAARQSVPDLIVLDLILPDMDGVEFTEICRKNEITKNIPIIVCTGQKKRETVIKLSALGIKDYLIKPFLPKSLIMRVEELLNIKLLRQE